MTVHVERLKFNREKQILVNLIINTEYCSKVLPVIEKEYFRSKSAGTIISWVRAYYDTYKSAPKQHINDIYDEYSERLESDEREQIGAVLTHISNDVSIETDNNNIQYLVDNAYDLCKSRLLEIQVNAAAKHIADGNYDLAEEALAKRFEVHQKTCTVMSWNDPKVIKEAIDYLVHQEDPDTAFFRYPGRLGDFIGNIERSWLVSFIAPSKRGKTIYMVESVLGAIQRNLNVVVFSLEMPGKQLFARVLKNVVGNRPGDEEYTVMSPIFDCDKNQTGSCTNPDRVGFGTLVVEGNRQSFEDAPDWITCTECRGTRDFVPCGWKVPVEKEAINEVEYFKKANAFMRLYGKRCRMIFYPSGSVTSVDINNDLQMLEETENFIADIVVIDYGDLIKPQKGGEKRHQLDATWEELRAIEQERNILVITASQTNRGEVDAKYVKETGIAEDYSKIAKLDLGIGLCQTEAMKERGEMNINKVVYRHGEFIQSHTCMVLQELGNMQAILDSEFQFR